MVIRGNLNLWWYAEFSSNVRGSCVICTLNRNMFIHFICWTKLPFFSSPLAELNRYTGLWSLRHNCILIMSINKQGQSVHTTAIKRQPYKETNKHADTQANRLTEKSKHILTSIQMKRHTGLWSPNVRNSFLVWKDDI